MIALRNKSLVEFDELKENVINHAFITKKTPRMNKKTKEEDNSLLAFF